MGGWRAGWRTIAGVAALLSAYPPIRLTAQVGHDPARSPFHDIKRAAGLQVLGGYIDGDRGTVGVGPAEVQTVMARYELPLGSPTRLALGLGYGRGNRYVLDPDEDASNRQSGPVTQELVFLEGALHLLLTGSKSWRGFVPYVGGVAGFAFGANEPADPGGYSFGARFMVGPVGGLRWYPTARLNAFADARLLFWKLSYPRAYQVAPPGGSAILPPIEDALSEWVEQGWLSIGLGWTF